MTTTATTTITAASTTTTIATTTTTTSFMTTSAAGTTTIVTKSSCQPADLTSLFFVREEYPDSKLDGGVYTIDVDKDYTVSFLDDNTYRGYLLFANKTFSGQISRLVFGFENVGFAALSLGDYPNNISTLKKVITPMSNNRNEGIEFIPPGSTYICTDVELYYKPIEDIKPVVIKLIRIEMCSGSLVPIDPDVYNH
ncbi:hypothetical protein HELRODRAFT_171107 [Helobdella robusta]|uniref:Uncharacterized protein n=1 Tax=Helobdella robusta TaxID=6412 RepID=T1F3T6_HELRO|nr:hypothetical protein HELRODRAFT_171107 [Helobdella robusta]ESO05476.1 hypothetical protein HELRODRAFT_171107 [Helobdella robusta]